MAKVFIKEYKSKDGYTTFRDYKDEKTGEIYTEAEYKTKDGKIKKTIYKNGKEI